jgi:NAD(P)-dependent dehydrogenase (short-subunit alcohol dehydrogenase family)
MIKSKQGGRIINLLSVDAFRPSGMLVAYDAAKAGLWAVTMSMAKEFAEHQILVNAVAPGATITPERIAALKDGTLCLHRCPPTLLKREGSSKTG